MKLIFLLMIALSLFVFSFFTFAVLVAGSHGHMGLFDHADSFLFYSVILSCVYIIFKINIYAFKVSDKDVRKVNKVGLILFLIIFSFIVFLLTIEYFSETPNIRIRDWFINLAFTIIAIGEYINYKKTANKIL